MDEVARLASALLADDEIVRLHAISALARHPFDPTAIAELMESLKNDLLGELAISAAVALADMANLNPAVTFAVGQRYRQTVGSIALRAAHDPTLRLTYFFAITGDRDWFDGARHAELRGDHARTARYLAAGRAGDLPAAARAMVWFESLAGRPGLFRTARTLLPGRRRLFRHLIRATR